MAADYLHNRKQFEALLRILEEEIGILAGLIEKDYWIMQVIYGLKKQGFQFELKAGAAFKRVWYYSSFFRRHRHPYQSSCRVKSG